MLSFYMLNLKYHFRKTVDFNRQCFVSWVAFVFVVFKWDDSKQRKLVLQCLPPPDENVTFDLIYSVFQEFLRDLALSVSSLPYVDFIQCFMWVKISFIYLFQYWITFG